MQTQTAAGTEWNLILFAFLVGPANLLYSLGHLGMTGFDPRPGIGFCELVKQNFPC